MPFQDLAESTNAKVTARILMPIMIGVLTILIGLLSWLLVRFVATNDAAMSEMRNSQISVGVQVSQLDKKVDLMTQSVDKILIRQVEQNSNAISEQGKRLDRIERSVKLP